MFFKKKQKKQIDESRIPSHVAFIMDGNGRWAKKRAMPRTYGHKVGVDSMGVVIRHALELKIKYVSFYAFSTENWNRPQDEVDEIFRLMADAIERRQQWFMDNNVRFMTIGDLSKLDKKLQEKLKAFKEATKNNNALTVNVAINYGARNEIVRAVNKIIGDGLKSVDEKTFAKYLDSGEIPDPDFVVRTSGEQRLSNFMLYQNAYAELYFPKTYWPDFREKEMDDAIIEFQGRDRKFGAIKKPIKKA